ncbi:MAG: hypothetical protein RR614_10100 [Eubacterium sp.]
MELLNSYKTTLEMLEKFIKEESKRNETEKVAKSFSESFFDNPDLSAIAAINSDLFIFIPPKL